MLNVLLGSGESCFEKSPVLVRNQVPLVDRDQNDLGAFREIRGDVEKEAAVSNMSSEGAWESSFNGWCDSLVIWYGGLPVSQSRVSSSSTCFSSRGRCVWITSHTMGSSTRSYPWMRMFRNEMMR